MEVTCTDRASFLHLPCYHPHLLLQCTCIHLQSAWSPALWPALIAPAVNILTFSCNPQCNTNLQCSTNLQICPPAIHFHLHWLHVWPPVETHALVTNFVHQVARLALVASLATGWRHLEDYLIGIISWYLHQPESHHLSLQTMHRHLNTGPIDLTPGIPRSNNKKYKKWTKELAMNAGGG